MKRSTLLATVCFFFLLAGSAFATPSTTYWTPVSAGFFSILTCGRTWLFRCTFADLAGFLNLVGRELHLVGQGLADADQSARLIRVLLDPLLEIIGIGEEALVKAPGGSPSAIGFLPLAEPRDRCRRLQCGNLSIESLDNDRLPGQAILLADLNVLAGPGGHAQGTVRAAAPGVYAAFHTALPVPFVRT